MVEEAVAVAGVDPQQIDAADPVGAGSNSKGTAPGAAHQAGSAIAGTIRLDGQGDAAIGGNEPGAVVLIITEAIEARRKRSATALDIKRDRITSVDAGGAGVGRQVVN